MYVACVFGMVTSYVRGCDLKGNDLFIRLDKR